MTKGRKASRNHKSMTLTGGEGELRKTDANHTQEHSRGLTRRTFLGAVGGATAAAMIVGTGGTSALAAAPAAEPQDFSPQGALSALNRNKKSFKYRSGMAEMARLRPVVTQQNNGDEDRYANKIGSYTKALPHNALGEVDLAAYATLAKAIQTQVPADFDAIQLGLGRKLTSPQAGLAMDLEGPD